MRFLFLIISFFAISYTAFAQKSLLYPEDSDLLYEVKEAGLIISVDANLSLYDALCELNKYWKNINPSHPVFNTKIEIKNWENLITLHLKWVERHLRLHQTPTLTAIQHQNRAHCLGLLNAYWRRGKFPKNTGHPEQILPYFIDDFNTACAVGHLIRETGNVVFANKVQCEMNYSYIEDMTYIELNEWAAQHGFSEMELCWIQPSYACANPTGLAYLNPSCGKADGWIWAPFFDTIHQVRYTWYAGKNRSGSPIGYGNPLKNVPAGEYTVYIEGKSYSNFDPCFPYRLIAYLGNKNTEITSTVSDQTCETPNGQIEVVQDPANPFASIELFQIEPVSFNSADYNYFDPNYSGHPISQGMGTTFTSLASEGQVSYYKIKAVDGDACIAYQFVLLRNTSYNKWYNQKPTSSCSSLDGEVSFQSALLDSVVWENGVSALIRNDLEAGFHLAEVFPTGCNPYNQTIFVEANNNSLIINPTNIQVASDKYTSDGKFTFEVSNGNPPYEVGYYDLNTSVLVSTTPKFIRKFTTNSNSITLDSLKGGLYFGGGNVPHGHMYKVVVQSIEGCTGEYPFNIELPYDSEFDVDVLQPSLCDNGEISIFPSDNAPAGCFRYDWSDGGQGAMRKNLTAGDYLLRIMDTCSRDMVYIRYFSLKNNVFEANALETIPPSCTNNDGYVKLESDKPGTYAYWWPDGIDAQTRNDLLNGTYNVTVSDGQQCYRVFVELEAPDKVLFNPLSTHIPVYPSGAQIEVSASSPKNLLQLTYTWSHDPSLNTATVIVADTAVLDYVLATDGESCPDTLFFKQFSTSISEMPFEADFARIYPNPASDFCHIQSSSPLKSIYVYDQMGRLVLEKKRIFATSDLINLSSLSAGLYLIQIISDNGVQVSRLLVGD